MVTWRHRARLNRNIFLVRQGARIVLLVVLDLVVNHEERVCQRNALDISSLKSTSAREPAVPPLLVFLFCAPARRSASCITHGRLHGRHSPTRSTSVHLAIGLLVTFTAELCLAC